LAVFWIFPLGFFMSKQQIAVIDYGMGNLFSVASALRNVAPDADVVVTGEAAVIEEADRVIFPGVGAMRDCMHGLRSLKLDEVIKQTVGQKPMLAICVGLQALMDHSEENNGVDCLGIMPGNVRFFGNPLLDSNGDNLKVPHMGWSCVEQTIDHPLWHSIENHSRFYFVHSYFVSAQNQNEVAAYCDYGYRFDAALYGEQLFAVQFHPEKSHHNGLQLLKNFAAWSGR
jgi:glutamine amidotransferase